MGSLTPGVGLVYERNGEEIYAREVGQPISERKLIGYMYENNKDPRTNDGRPLIEHMREDQMWGEIRRMAPTNPALQKALDRAIMIYKLSKDKLR
jgi:methyl coenzyme M reductase alpha subunit